MNLYKIWQDVNHEYDTYDSAVVCAENEDEAKQISIDEFVRFYDPDDYDYHAWTTIDKVQCKLIGIADEDMTKGIVVASFNAG